jgi:hypothetical protein
LGIISTEEEVAQQLTMALLRALRMPRREKYIYEVSVFLSVFIDQAKTNRFRATSHPMRQ